MPETVNAGDLTHLSWVRLCIPESLKATFEEHPISQEQVFKTINHEIFIDFRVGIDENFVHWVQCMGPQVEVIYPLELRELIRRNLSETLYKYRLV